MSDPKKALEEAELFVRANLKILCKELVVLQNTGQRDPNSRCLQVLEDRLQAIVSIPLPLAERMISTACIHRIALDDGL